MALLRRWLLGRTHRAQGAFIGDKVAYLFCRVRHPSGREYTVEEVAQATGLPSSYVTDLRRTRISNFRREQMDALNAFFGVDSGYWFRAMNYIDEHDLNYPQCDRPVRKWTPEEVEMLTQMLVQVRDHLAALRDDPSAKDTGGRPTP